MQRFPLGRVVATRACLSHLVSIKASAMPYLERHQSGDWGYLGRSDKQANEDAIQYGGRILSKYLLKDGTPIYVITEADRSYTTVMLCSDY
jgi:hypothetical protein